ncbi:MAG TPA: CHAP domain-containing protein [Candidatus Dormibacteraeota bacterium]
MVVRRYLVHGVVLVLALALSGYASLDHGLPGGLSLRLGAVNPEGLIMGQGGQVGNVQLGRASTIVKPVAIPKTAAVSHTPITYEVKDGETLKDLSSRFKVSTDSIRWSNFTALKNMAKDVSKGQKILIPPVDGVVVTTQQGDTPMSLANTYHVTPGAIIDFNYLRTGEQDPVQAGTALVVPGGQGPDFERPASVRSTFIPVAHGGSGGYSIVSVGGSYPTRAGNRFSYGYCTWYVFNRRQVPWLGDAWQWFGNAQAAGYATGQTPRVGAILVTWESSWGHVAYVEAVNADGSYTVSEMNFVRWNVIDQRTIKPGGVPLIGFIY